MVVDLIGILLLEVRSWLVLDLEIINSQRRSMVCIGSGAYLEIRLGGPRILGGGGGNMFVGGYFFALPNIIE